MTREAPDGYQTILEVALEAKSHFSTVDRAIRVGELPATWSFGRRLLKREDVIAWIALRATRSRAPAVHEAHP